MLETVIEAIADRIGWHQLRAGRRVIRFKFCHSRLGIRGPDPFTDIISVGFGFGVFYTYTTSLGETLALTEAEE